MTNTAGRQGWRDASDPDPGPQEREMNSRPAVGSESCGPMIIVFKGREGAPLLAQASDRLRDQANSAWSFPSDGPLARFTTTP